MLTPDRPPKPHAQEETGELVGHQGWVFADRVSESDVCLTHVFTTEKYVVKDVGDHELVFDERTGFGAFVYFAGTGVAEGFQQLELAAVFKVEVYQSSDGLHWLRDRRKSEASIE